MQLINRLAIAFAGAFACLAGGTPAIAQSEDEPPMVSAEAQSIIAAENFFRPQGEWGLASSPDGCLAQRSFAHGERTVSLTMRQLQPGMAMQFWLIGTGFEADEPLDAGFVPDSALTRYELIGRATLGGADGLFYAGQLFRGSLAEQSEAAQQARFYVAQSEDEPPVVLQTGPIQPTLDSLARCASEQLAGYGIDVRQRGSHSRHARMINVEELTGRLGQAYNSLSRSTGARGNMVVRVIVDAEGMPVACHAGDDLTPRSLRTLACETVRERGRFEPALDEHGDPVADYFLQGIRFAIPPPANADGSRPD